MAISDFITSSVSSGLSVKIKLCQYVSYSILNIKGDVLFIVHSNLLTLFSKGAMLSCNHRTFYIY